MSQIIYSEQTHHDFARLCGFVEQIDPKLKSVVVATVMAGIDTLGTFPEIAPFCQDESYKHMRELFIPYGKSGYLVLYQYTKTLNEVLIAAIRHSKESGYKM